MSDNDLVDPSLANDYSDLLEVDEEQMLDEDAAQQVVANLSSHRRAAPAGGAPAKKLKRRRPTAPVPAAANEVTEFDDLPTSTLKRRELHDDINARMDAALKSKGTRRKKQNEHDLEQIQDEVVENLRRRMTEAARADAEAVENNEIATHKLEMLPDVKNVLVRLTYAVAILDNNLLDAVRLWLEPLPDRSLPAYAVQATLLEAVQNLPITTDHLLALGLGKIMIFYLRLKKVEPALKRIAEKLIAEWTRPIMKKLDNYRNKQIQSVDFDMNRFLRTVSKLRGVDEPKTLYQELADRRKRAAAPTARALAYKIAPRVDPLAFRHTGVDPGAKSDAYRAINQRLAASRKKAGTKKGGVSIEGRGLN